VGKSSSDPRAGAKDPANHRRRQDNQRGSGGGKGVKTSLVRVGFWLFQGGWKEDRGERLGHRFFEEGHHCGRTGGTGTGPRQGKRPAGADLDLVRGFSGRAPFKTSDWGAGAGGARRKEGFTDRTGQGR